MAQASLSTGSRPHLLHVSRDLLTMYKDVRVSREGRMPEVTIHIGKKTGATRKSRPRLAFLAV